jgi:hypothetical protein
MQVRTEHPLALSATKVSVFAFAISGRIAVVKVNPDLASKVKRQGKPTNSRVAV